MKIKYFIFATFFGLLSCTQSIPLAAPLAPGATVKLGQQIALLGDGYSDETDGERKHLHFAIIPGESSNLKGYVQNESELSGWIDPLEFFAEKKL